MKPEKLTGHAAMFGANAMWGIMSPVAKMVMAAGVVSPIVMTDFRIQMCIRDSIDAIQVRERFCDPSPDTVTQFRRCRPCECHDENLLHFQLLFQKQTQVQALSLIHI